MKLRRPRPEEHPRGSGRYRVRTRVDGVLRTLTRPGGVPLAEAERVADDYVRGTPIDVASGPTLASFGPAFLDRRERNGVAGIKQERDRWSLMVERDPLGAIPLAKLTRRDLLAWRDRWAKRGYQTRYNALNLVQLALDDALDHELVEANLARTVKIPKSARRTEKDSLEGILTPDEQLALLAAVPAGRERQCVMYALFAGVRQSSQWGLERKDCHADCQLIRKHKNGRPRLLYPLSMACDAVAASLASHDSRWAFPAPRGGRRVKGHQPVGWHRWVRAAGIKRRIRWHDLRHTCATSLLAGWWGERDEQGRGRKWSLDEVCEYLGHSSVKVTERYARKLAETQRLAVAETKFPASSPLVSLLGAEPVDIAERRGSDSNRRVTVLQGGHEPRVVAAVPDPSAPENPGKFPSGHSPAAWALALAAESALRGRVLVGTISLPGRVKRRKGGRRTA